MRHHGIPQASGMLSGQGQWLPWGGGGEGNPGPGYHSRSGTIAMEEVPVAARAAVAMAKG